MHKERSTISQNKFLYVHMHICMVKLSQMTKLTHAEFKKWMKMQANIISERLSMELRVGERSNI